jgi:hypothetical protein
MTAFRPRSAPAVFAVIALAAAVPASAAPAPIQYRIDARLDAARGAVSGRETITWRNETNEPRLLAVCAAPGQQTIVDGGLAARTLAPGESATLHLEWTTTVIMPGGGVAVGDHWYPRAAIGVAARDATCLPAFAGVTAPDPPADFEIDLDVPRGWLVAATGREQGTADTAGAATTHRFRQRGVREFSWVTGPYYLERQRRVDGPTHPVDLRLLVQPEHAAQAARLLDAAADALARHTLWLSEYDGDYLTMVDTGWRDATDDRSYPGLVTFATRWMVPSTTLLPEAAVARGISGQWWGGVVRFDSGARELADAARDYFTGMIVEHLFDVRHQRLAYSTLVRSYFGGFIPWAWRDIRVSRASAYRLRGARGFATLERYLGAPVLQRALAAVIEPRLDAPESRHEFFRLLGDAAGQDLRWFDEAVFERAGAFDYGVDSVSSVPDTTCDLSPCFRTTVVTGRHGDGQFTGASEPPIGPYDSGRAVRVDVSFIDGGQATDTWDGRSRSKSFVFRSRAPAASVRVDPDRTLLLDVNQTNNGWTRTPATGAASARWAATWLTWLQDCLLSYAALA